MKTTTLLIFAFILVAILLFSFQWQQESTIVTTPTPIPKTEADYFLENVVMTSYNSEGDEANQVIAKRIEHFKQKQLSIVQEPQLKAQNSASSNWHITSDSGRLDHHQQALIFEKSVAIEGKIQVGKKHGEQYSIQTQDLSFDLTNNTAESKTSVLIRSQAIQTYANKFYADLNSDEIQLTGNVSTSKTTLTSTK
ncbi:MAG: LPS export ABC transporter periplasmic protein LptC [Kangiellaceae bacterium]|nr:LPS export ABC transporter periplasmic protein LptC [Kangiellaceae bacterium]MCW9000141.1 LPS export ABC transporter periplasmic protein LptC [Kangiellaceae bacterium]